MLPNFLADWSQNVQEFLFSKRTAKKIRHYTKRKQRNNCCLFFCQLHLSSSVSLEKNGHTANYCATSGWTAAARSSDQTSPSAPSQAPGARSVWPRGTRSPSHAPGPWSPSKGAERPAAASSWRTVRLPTWCTNSPVPGSSAASASAYRTSPSHVAVSLHCAACH